MPSRTRTRVQKVSASAQTIRIPKGRRSEPVIVVVPERPSLTRQALMGLALIVWDHRRALAPTSLALLAFGVAVLLHLVAWWSGLVLAPAVLAPLAWLAMVQRRRPAHGSDLAWRIALSVASTLAAGWMAAGAILGPLTGPLELLWLLALICTQTTWLVVLRTHLTEEIA